MTIYFTASIVGKKWYLAHYQQIISLLQARGHTVISDHIMDTSKSRMNLESRDEVASFQEQLDTWISTCDFVIAEVSHPSISVGYEISLALQRRKPVLILYSEGQPPKFFAFSRDENVICEHYTTESLSDTLDTFIDYVSGIHEMRFTFFITPTIAAHMEKISKERNIPKSAYLRSLIEKDM